MITGPVPVPSQDTPKPPDHTYPRDLLACYLTLVSWVVPSCLSCSGVAW